MIVLGITFGVSPALAAGGDIIWQYDDAQSSQQEALSSVVDSGGNVIVTGYTLNGSEDFYTAKIQADGTDTLWIASFDLAGGTDRSVDIAVDQNDDVLVTGYAWNGSNYDFHTIKYSGADGSVIWQNTFNAAASGTDIPSSIAVDALDNVYVGGYAEGISGSEDFMLIKYSPTGANPDGTPIWTASYNGGANNQDRINAIDAGVDGVVATGYSHNGTDFDFLTIKYGLDGSQTWLKTYDSTLGDDQALTTVFDSSGNVLVTGSVFNGTGQDIYTIKYQASDGTVSWFKTYDGGYADQGRHIWIDSANDVYLTGSSFTLTGFTDLYTVRYAAADGAIVWEEIYNSGGDNTDIPTGITVDEAGEVYVAGYTTKASADDDMLVVKYKKDNGTLLWDSSFNGTNSKNDKAMSIGLDASGHVLVGGWSDMWTAGANDYDFYAIKFDAGLLNPPTALSASTVSVSAVDITWTDNSANEDGFKIWRKIGDAGSWTQIDTVGANVTSYSDTGLSAHIWHYYKVQAYNAGDGDSHFTNEDGELTTVVTYSAPTWSYIYNNPDDGDDFAYAIATGDDNHPVVTGSSQTAQNGTYMSQDYHTVKLDRTNASELWSVGYNDVDDEMDIATSVVVDDNNDVVVSGFSSLYGGGASNTNDIYTLKYPGAGPPAFGDSHLWDDQYNGPAGDDDRSEAIDAAVDGSNSTVVTGYGKNVSANDDIYVVKYLTDGTRQWAMTPFNGAANGNDYPARVAFDYNGDLVVTGKTHNGTDYDIFTRKLSGSDGSTIWTKIFDSTYGWDEGREVVIDNNNDVYVAGVVVNSNSNDDMYLVKYASATGNLVWSKTIDGPANGHDIGESVRVDANNNEVVVSGTVLAGPGNNDFYLARYNESGTLIWDRQFQRDANDDNVVAMGMDISGNVCLAGNTDNNFSIDLLAIKYDAYGNIIGSTLFNGTADDDDDVFEIASNNLGEQFIAGYTTNASGNADYLVVMCMGDVLQAPVPLISIGYYTSVDLAWTDTTSDEDGFSIERKLNGCSSANPWELIHTATADTVSYSDTSLNMSTTYCYRVRAFKNSGEVSTWLETEATTTEPAAPTGFTATPVNTTQINLGWTDNTTGEDGFLVERCSGSGCSDYVFLAQTPADSTSFNDDSVCESQVYSYRVLAYKAGDWQSAFSTPDIDNSTGSKVIPSGFTATRISEGEISLSWTDTTADESGFNIERCAGAGCSDFAALVTVADDTTLYSDTTGLAPDTTYRYRINASKTASCSWTTGWSLIAEAATTLLAPTVLSATQVNTTQIDLAWNDNTGFETGFKIERCSGTGCSAFALLATAGADATSYSDTTVCENFTYVYRVRAVKSTAPVWNSGWSNTDEQSAAGIQAPDSLLVTRSSEEQISISWNDNSSDETGFEIDRCVGTGCDFSVKTTITVGMDTTSYMDTSLAPDTTYRYQVRAVKSASCSWQSDYSTGAEATTTLFAPSGLAATPVDTTTVDLSWTDNTSHETGFTVERCAGAGCSSFIEIDRVSPDAESYRDTSACTNTEYNYRIKAVDEGMSNSGGSCWTRRAPLTITGFQANQAFRVFVNYDADMQADFADIRFFDTTAQEELPYWIVNKTDSASATVWVKGGINNNVVMYYGNSLATSVSSKAAFEFEMFDDFPGTTIDSANWVEIDPNNSIEQNDALLLNDVNDGWTKALISQQTFSRVPGKTYYADLTTGANTPGNDHFMTGWELNQTTNSSYNQLVHALYWNNYRLTTYQRTSHTGPNTQPYTANTQYEMKVVLKSAGARYMVRGGAYTDWTLVQETSNYTDATMRIGFTQYSHQAFVNFVAVADESNIADKTASVGAEEQNACYSFNSWESSYSNAAPATTPQAAGATTLVATAVSESQVDLTWVDNSTDESGYKVERCDGGGCSVFTIIDDTLPADSISFSDTGLAMSTSYTYKVQAFKNATCPWDQVYSNQDTAVTLSPPAPSGLTATTINTTQINLAWTDNTGAETGFSIERCEGAGCSVFAEVATVGADITSYSDDSIAYFNSYTYRVRAVNSVVPWSSDPSNEATAVSDQLQPPDTLVATRISEVQIDLSWNDNSNDETNFRIEQGASDCTGFTEIGTAAADETTYTDSGLQVGTTYCYRIRAYKSATQEWYTVYSNTFTATTAIDAPSGLSTTAVNTTQVDLAWGDNSSSETGFEIERCNDAGCSSPVLLTTVAADATTYSDTTCVHTTNYWYRVRAVNSGVPWNSSYSSIQTATTPSPAAPTTLSAIRISEIQIDLSWADNSNDETGFKIERCQGAGCSDFVQIGLAPADATSYQDTGLLFATEYSYRIRAYKTTTNSWDSGYSNTSSATTSVAAPAGLAATPINTTQVDLTWTDTTASETGFEIERCQDTGCSIFAQIAAVGADVVSYSDTSVCNNQTYTYRVRAVKGTDWNSPYSNTPETSTPGWAAPTGLNAVSNTQNSLDLSWTDNSPDETVFKIERCEGAGCSGFSEITTVAADSTAYLDNTGVNPSTTYCYRVRASKTATCGWDSSYSNISCDHTIQAAATSLTVTAISSMKITLDWIDNSSDEDAYEVYQKIWNGRYVLVDTLPVDSATYTKTFGINPETEYSFKVRAIRGSDVSAFSNEASDTTPAWQSSDTTCE